MNSVFTWKVQLFVYTDYAVCSLMKIKLFKFQIQKVFSSLVMWSSVIMLLSQLQASLFK